jgi:threonine dehydrogenase-like Zn-dependent dehydrogenase
MESVVIRKPRELFLSEREIPVPCLGEVLIKVMASGICGTGLG